MNLMDRRRAIRLIAGIGLMGVLLFWLYRKFGFGSKFDASELRRYKQTIDHLAETIIPETETPGAMRAQVGDFIIRMISDCSSPKVQYNFLRGVKQVEDHCQRKYGRHYAQCTADDRISVLERFERNAVSRFAILNKVNNKIFGTPFIVQLKALTVEGYCTSELGATKALAYDPIPVHYLGCMPLAPGQKTWAI